MGGSPMLYVNLIWTWGHPEVYILVLPAFGIYSEVTATFSRKALFGYKSMVYATVAIGVLSLVVWVHHFFTMGAGANVNAFFGIMTMIIAIPTGVKIFSWLFTMYKGRITYTTPMLWTLGFLVTFGIGGLTGVLMAVPPADFLVHNSLFLIAHFHNVIIGGVVFAMFAGIIFYWPKMFGWRLNETWGKAAFWFWFFGFYFAFMPLYILGFMGMTRRLNTYDNPEWDPYLAIAFFGSVLIAIGIFCFVMQIVVGFLTTQPTIWTLLAIHGMVVRLNGLLLLQHRSITLLTFQRSMVLILSGLTKKMVLHTLVQLSMKTSICQPTVQLVS